MLKNVDQIIGALGGVDEAARLATVKRHAVYMWRKRRRIPKDLLALFQTRLQDLGQPPPDPRCFGARR